MNEVLERHPLPWRVIGENGEDRIVDALGYYVELRRLDTLLLIAATMNAMHSSAAVVEVGK